ncbi:hypothetical protein DM860_011728 [Cuscuta australis]|uniref:Uncharacterized protein n=1 Tax=Cuscuta australis TaxID=267555 RepID=A0A328DJU1_9ASTE|nr:hypothetical protein DM860_011728 [Cuscuta australis]
MLYIFGTKWEGFYRGDSGRASMRDDGQSTGSRVQESRHPAFESKCEPRLRDAVSLESLS